MFIIVEFAGDDHFTHIVDTNKLEPALKQDVETKVKNDPYANFTPKYWKELQNAVIAGPGIFPVMIEGNTTVYID
jgi:roadblock/LC7 domain-containing protein